MHWKKNCIFIRKLYHLLEWRNRHVVGDDITIWIVCPFNGRNNSSGCRISSSNCYLCFLEKILRRNTKSAMRRQDMSSNIQREQLSILFIFASASLVLGLIMQIAVQNDLLFWTDIGWALTLLLPNAQIYRKIYSVNHRSQ